MFVVKQNTINKSAKFMIKEIDGDVSCNLIY